MTKLLTGRLGFPGAEAAFPVQLLISAPVCLLISRTLEPDGPAHVLTSFTHTSFTQMSALLAILVCRLTVTKGWQACIAGPK